jgi:preprotein translocase subunit SecE
MIYSLVFIEKINDGTNKVVKELSNKNLIMLLKDGREELYKVRYATGIKLSTELKLVRSQ